jgi:hypothetical protein
MAKITKSNLAKKTTLPDLPDSNSLSRRRARRTLPQFSPPCLGAAIVSLTKPRLHFNFEKSISPYSHSGEAKKR